MGNVCMGGSSGDEPGRHGSYIAAKDAGLGRTRAFNCNADLMCGVLRKNKNKKNTPCLRLLAVWHGNARERRMMHSLMLARSCTIRHRTARHATTRHVAAASTGGRLGGDATTASGLAPREAAAAAAEARYKQSAGSEVDAKRRKDELIGRIAEAYTRRGEQAPMGLRTMDLEQLNKVWARMQQQGRN
jgi:hypothetical protein